MKKLIKITSSILLVLFVSGCDQNNLTAPSKPKIDQSLESVNSSSLRTIPDITSIALEWQKVDDPRIDRYYLYRTKIQENGQKLKRVNTIQNRYSTHFSDTNLDPNTQYTYAISAATKKGFESIPTESFTVSTLNRPNSVSYIQAISDLPRQIKILWRPHENQRVEKYTIQRTSPATSKWRNIKSISGRLSVEYIDDDLKDNVVYLYRVVAKTFDGINSLPSEIVKAQTKSLPFGAQNLTASNNHPRKISLNWESSKSSDIIKYKIYSNTNAKGSFDHIATVSSDTFSYNDLVNEDGAIRFYKTTAIDKDNLETALNMNAVMGNTLAKINKPIMTLAQIQGEKAILNWEMGDERTVSYIVHKKIKEDMFNTKTIKFTNVTDLRFEDKDIIRGVEYTYTLQGVDEFGILSERTNETTLILPKLQKVN
jgi:hypothetical protein